MCNEETEKDIDEFLASAGDISRRDFTRISAAMGLSAALPRVVNAAQTNESDVKIATPDGTADCYFVHPVEGKHAAVLVWPDILGLRPAFRAMGKRLAESGYAVLVVNPYYRERRAPVVGPGASFRQAETREVVLPLARKLNAETHMSDARAFIAFLDNQEAVDTDRKIGTTGYCMGGPIVMRTAAAVPERIGAIASFHGGGLVTDRGDSPHLLIPNTHAEVLHAIAENDDDKDPQAKDILRSAYAAAGLAAEIEVYKGAMHGWCPPDSVVYNKVQAERAWERLLALLARALA